MKPGNVGLLVAATCTGVSIGIVCFLLYKYSNSFSSAPSKKKRRDSHSSSGGKDARNRDSANVATADLPQENVKAGGDNTQSQTEVQKQSSGSSSSGIGDLEGSDGFTTIKLSVPKEMIGAIIGRQGCNIKQIQSETKTKIDFSKQVSEGPERTITIRGSEKGTQDAELKILHITYGQPTKQTTKALVPRRTLGFIIGRGGENINRIQSDSGCRVKVSSDRDCVDPEAMSEVFLTGTDEQIVSALAMIDEYVEECETKNRKTKLLKEQSRPRQQLSRGNRIAAKLPGSPLASEQWPSHSDYVECYVTATSDPTHVWVQLLTPGAHKLEEVNAELSNLYSNHKEFRDDLVASPPAIGTTLAARNPIDNKWYRGTLSAYSTDSEEKAVDVYYVDYGDSCWMPFENYNVQLLRPEFYRLAAQAVECYTELLLNPDCPAEWTDEDSGVFERLSHTGSWKVLMGRVIKWDSKPGSKAKADDELPIIKLIDTNNEQDIDICAELLKNLNRNSNNSSGDNSVADAETVTSSEVCDVNGRDPAVPVIVNTDHSTLAGSGNTELSTVADLGHSELSTVADLGHSELSTVADSGQAEHPTVADSGRTELSTVEAVIPAGYNYDSDEDAWD